MGTVYRAFDTKLNRPVAIKFLSSDLADADARRRFQREAQLASSLNHPHILTVHDAGEFEGREYLVTEFVDSGTLKDWARGKHSWRQVVELLAGVADGLAAAHAAGITHRDIKPANILVAANGYAKLADFGLAKLTETTSRDSDETQTLTAGPTRQGVVVGTVAYMSPEQASGQKVDTRSDIFSFGVVLYELLAGRRPFGGKTNLEVMQAIIHGAGEPLGEEVPVALRLAVDKALAKDPSERYQSMREMVVDFRRLVHQSGEVPASGVSRPAHRRFRRAWSVLLPVLLAATYFGWQAWRVPPQSDAPLRAIALTTFPGSERYPSFSPDGDRVAFTWGGPRQDNPDIYVQQVGSGSPLRRTTDPGSDFSAAWSPDGRQIAFLRHASSALGNLAGNVELRVVPPLGGPERKLAEIQMAPESFTSPRYLSWCPDSNCLVVAEETGLFAISLDTGVKRRLTTSLSGRDTDPAVSPDGRSLVFSRSIAVLVSSIYSLPMGKDLAADVEPQRLTTAPLVAAHPAWTPDGKEILFSASGSLWRLLVPREKTDGGIPPSRLAFVGEDGLMPVISRTQSSASSRLVYVRNSVDYNIWRVQTSGPGVPSSSPPVAFVSSTRGDANPQVSPDGGRLAYASNRAGDWEIWVSDSDGSNAVQLTSMGASLTTLPAWSPDGQQITFHSNLEGQYEIYVVPVSGGRPRPLTAEPFFDGFPNFSKDGHWVYFQSGRNRQVGIWKVPVSGGDATQVTTNTSGGTLVVSPDGAFVYYGTGTTLWRLPVSGGQPVKVLEGVFNGSFAVVEQGIYFIERIASENRLQFFDHATRQTTTVTRNLGEVLAGLATSADGRTIFYTRVDSTIDDLMLVENFR
jgi:serine/threonine protein kinase